MSTQKMILIALVIATGHVILQGRVGTARLRASERMMKREVQRKMDSVDVRSDGRGEIFAKALPSPRVVSEEASQQMK